MNNCRQWIAPAIIILLFLAAGPRGSGGRALAREAADSALVLFEETFEDTSFTGRGWYDGPGMNVVHVEDAPQGDGCCILEWSRAGATGPEGRGGRAGITPASGVTLSFHIRMSDNWEWGNRGYHPHFMHFVTNRDSPYVGPAFTHLTFYIEPVDGRLRFAIQDGANIDQDRVGQDLVGVTEDRAVAGGNGDSDGYGGGAYLNGDLYWNGKHFDSEKILFSDEQGPYYKGDWHHIRVHFQLNSIVDGVGVANGVLRAWCDGEQVMDYDDILFRTGRFPDMKINQYLLAPYIGYGAPHGQTIWIDHIRIERTEQELPVPRGSDVNGDGSASVDDAIDLMGRGLRNPGHPSYDRNSDGRFDVADVLALLIDIIRAGTILG